MHKILLIAVALISYTYLNAKSLKEKEDSCEIVSIMSTPAFLAEDKNISYKKTSYTYYPEIDKNDRILAKDSIFSTYVIYSKGKFLLELYHETKVYKMYLLNETKNKGLNVCYNSKKKYLSTGRYLFKKDLLVLTDIQNGVSNVAKKITMNTFRFENICFSFLRGKTLYNEPANLEPDDLFPQKPKMPLFETLNSEDFQQEYQYGKYKGIYISNDMDLLLFLEDVYYYYYVCGLPISTGSYFIKERVIELNDSSLTHTFYMRITPQGIQSAYLPGDREGVLLKKIKD